MCSSTFVSNSRISPWIRADCASMSGRRFFFIAGAFFFAPTKDSCSWPILEADAETALAFSIARKDAVSASTSSSYSMSSDWVLTVKRQSIAWRKPSKSPSSGVVSMPTATTVTVSPTFATRSFNEATIVALKSSSGFFSISANGSSVTRSRSSPDPPRLLGIYEERDLGYVSLLTNLLLGGEFGVEKI